MTDRSLQVAPPGFAEPTFGQRIAARLLDLLVLLPVTLPISLALDGQARTAIGLAIVAAYEIVLVARRGQTLGKMAMGTRVVDLASGSVPGPTQAVVRWPVVIAGALVTLAIPALALADVVYTFVVIAPILRPPLHRGLHDVVAGTVVTSLRAGSSTR